MYVSIVIKPGAPCFLKFLLSRRSVCIFVLGVRVCVCVCVCVCVLCVCVSAPKAASN